VLAVVLAMAFGFRPTLLAVGSTARVPACAERGDSR
jgi:hypothetical protein